MAVITSERRWATNTPVPCVMDVTAYNVFRQYDGALIEVDYYTISGVSMRPQTGPAASLDIKCTGAADLERWLTYLGQCGYDAKKEIVNYDTVMANINAREGGEHGKV